MRSFRNISSNFIIKQAVQMGVSQNTRYISSAQYMAPQACSDIPQACTNIYLFLIGGFPLPPNFYVRTDVNFKAGVYMNRSEI